MGEYNERITTDIQARNDLFLEISRRGSKVGTGNDLALLVYLAWSAYWKPGGNVGHGVVTEKWASISEIMKWTKMSRSTVYASLGHLEDNGWIEMWEVEGKLGKIRIRVRLDDAGRRARTKVPRLGNKFRNSDSQSETRTTIPSLGFISQGDLRKWALNDIERH